MRRFLICLAGLALAGVLGCEGGPTEVCLERDPLSGVCTRSGQPTPTPTPVQAQCPFTVGVEPLQVAGAYFVKATPAGPFTVVVGNVIYGAPDEGVVVYGTSGSIVSACRPCGCALPVALP